MDAVNDWIWSNLLLALILNVAGATAFVYIIVRLAYKIFRREPVSAKDKVIGIIAIALALVFYILTGLDDSPISL